MYSTIVNSLVSVIIPTDTDGSNIVILVSSPGTRFRTRLNSSAVSIILSRVIGTLTLWTVSPIPKVTFWTMSVKSTPSPVRTMNKLLR